MDELEYTPRPCVGCGFCCRKTPCELAYRIHGGGLTRCPELTYHDGRWWCSAVERAVGPLADEYREGLYIGAGCCSALNSDRLKIPTPEQVGWGKGEKVADQTNWKGAFQSLCTIMGNEFLNPDLLTLMAVQLQRRSGPRVAKEFVHWVKENRSPFVEQMMRGFDGEIPSSEDEPGG